MFKGLDQLNGTLGGILEDQSKHWGVEDHIISRFHGLERSDRIIELVMERVILNVLMLSRFGGTSTSVMTTISLHQ